VNLFRLLALAVIGWFCWRTFRGIQRSRNERERALAIRGAVAFWVLGAVFIASMFALPTKGRIFLLIPLVLVMGSAWKSYRNSRREIRESANLDAKLERMKRVN
jgi:DMSO reductase anchor subunit